MFQPRPVRSTPWHSIAGKNLIDHLFNFSEKQVARMLLQPATDSKTDHKKGSCSPNSYFYARACSGDAAAFENSNPFLSNSAS
jgi:hypothetical protein